MNPLIIRPTKPFCTNICQLPSKKSMMDMEEKTAATTSEFIFHNDSAEIPNAAATKRIPQVENRIMANFFKATGSKISERIHDSWVQPILDL